MTEFEFSIRVKINHPDIREQLGLAHQLIEQMDFVYSNYKLLRQQQPQNTEKLKRSALETLVTRFNVFKETQSTGYTQKSELASQMAAKYGTAYYLLVQEQDSENKLRNFLNTHPDFARRVGVPPWLPPVSQVS